MEQLLLSYLILGIEISFIHDLYKNDKNDNKRRFYFLFFFLQFFLFAGFRGLEVHPDTPTYDWHFDEVSNEGPFWEVEKNVFNYGYLYLEKFIHNNITSSVLGFNILTCFIICLCSFSLFYKKAHHMGIAIFLYYISGEFFTQFGVLRESFAVLIGYYVINLISKRKFLLSFLLSLVAMSLHSSAILLIILILLERMELGKGGKKYLLLIVVGIIYLIAPLVEFVTGMLEYESKYFTTQGSERGFATLNGFFNGGIGILVCAGLYKMIKNAEERGYEQDGLSKNILYIYFILSLISLRLSIVSRFFMYLNPLVFVIISNLCFISKKNIRCALFIMLVLASNVVVKQAVRPSWIGIFPYYIYSDEQLKILAPPE